MAANEKFFLIFFLLISEAALNDHNLQRNEAEKKCCTISAKPKSKCCELMFFFFENCASNLKNEWNYAWRKAMKKCCNNHPMCIANTFRLFSFSFLDKCVKKTWRVHRHPITCTKRMVCIPYFFAVFRHEASANER